MFEQVAHCANLGEPGAPELTGRPFDRRQVPRASVKVAAGDVELVEDLIEEAVRRERALVDEPGHVAQGRPGSKHPTRLAERASTVGDELEDKGRKREIERLVRERQGVRKRHLRPESCSVAAEPAIRDRVGHCPHARRGIDTDDRDGAPAINCAKGQLPGAGSDIEHADGPVGDPWFRAIKESLDRRRQDRRPPLRVPLRDAVVPFCRLRHPGIVPCRSAERGAVGSPVALSRPMPAVRRGAVAGAAGPGRHVVVPARDASPATGRRQRARQGPPGSAPRR